jgi:Cell wall binding domain 2 (CWB2)
VLARSDLFPDALAGVPLAAASTGPLLITPPTQLDGRVAAEMQRILPLDRPVYLLGGTGALSQAVEEQVKALGYTTVTRLAGPDRFATALAIAIQVEQVLGEAPFVVLVATGRNFPDALAAGAAAGFGGVVVLSNDATLPQPVRDYVVVKQQVDNALVATVGGPAEPSYPEADLAIPVRTATRPPPSWPMSSSSSPEASHRWWQGWRRVRTSRTPSAVVRSWPSSVGRCCSQTRPPSTHTRGRSSPRTVPRSTPPSSSVAAAPSPTSSTGRSQPPSQIEARPEARPTSDTTSATVTGGRSTSACDWDAKFRVRRRMRILQIRCGRRDMTARRPQMSAQEDSLC